MVNILSHTLLNILVLKCYYEIIKHTLSPLNPVINNYIPSIDYCNFQSHCCMHRGYNGHVLELMDLA